MTFMESSFLVQLYVAKLQAGVITKPQVPALFNLREVVYKVFDAEAQAFTV